MYRAHIDAVTAYFARRSTDPQTVADLTADTFVEAITSYSTFDPRRGTARAWLFGIARRVFAKHCESDARHRERAVRLAGRRDLAADHVEELLDRIDAEREGRALVSELTRLPDLDGGETTVTVQAQGLPKNDTMLVLRSPSPSPSTAARARSPRC